MIGVLPVPPAASLPKVPDIVTIEPEKSQVAAKDEIVVENPSDFQDTPSFPNQLTKYPETVRRGMQQLEVFDATNPDELVRYNRLLAKQIPHGAPGIEIIGKPKEYFSSHHCKLLLTIRYRALKYLRMTRKPA